MGRNGFGQVVAAWLLPNNKNEELEKECGVCYEPMESTIIRLQCGEGCGFTVCGGGCADNVSECPICHGPITARVSV